MIPAYGMIILPLNLSTANGQVPVCSYILSVDTEHGLYLYQVSLLDLIFRICIHNIMCVFDFLVSLDADPGRRGP